MSNKIKKVRIYVTKDNIAKGERTQIYCCPVALALKRTLNKEALVNQSWIDINTVLGYHQLTTPQKASNFINNFDAGREVKPFQFTLEVPECLLS